MSVPANHRHQSHRYHHKSLTSSTPANHYHQSTPIPPQLEVYQNIFIKKKNLRRHPHNWSITTTFADSRSNILPTSTTPANHHQYLAGDSSKSIKSYRDIKPQTKGKLFLSHIVVCLSWIFKIFLHFLSISFSFSIFLIHLILLFNCPDDLETRKCISLSLSLFVVYFWWKCHWEWFGFDTVFHRQWGSVPET